ncbi:MAG: hypothetical protein JKY65_30450 [Planctomycetes bacterium]|nr:hypothetical protein [Planctomycetota bacterium]
MTDWPFPHPENTACMTVRQVLQDGQPILYVTRDVDDGMFQFLTGGSVTTEDAKLVSLGSMLSHDDTLRGVAGLSLGASATRADSEGPWKWSLPFQSMPTPTTP